nr:uncharacterized protein LOC124814984 [Hydra vulgaris]
MSWNGVGKLTFIDEKMDVSMYCEILKANLRPSTKKLRMGNDFILLHDNDPKHTVKKTKVYFDKTSMFWYTWTKHPCFGIKIGNQAFRCKNNLKKVRMSTWDNITTKETQNLVNSMPNCLAEAIKAKVGPLDTNFH